MFVEVAIKVDCFKEVVSYCRDPDRVYCSWTCKSLRSVIEPWIPSRLVFRTMTRPRVQPKIFVCKNNVWAITRPASLKDCRFLLSMVAHLDNNRFGVSVKKWLGVTLQIREGSLLESKTILTKMMTGNSEELVMLKDRIVENYDDCIVLNAGPIWVHLSEEIAQNTSIANFIFQPTKHRTSYAKVFWDLSNRQHAVPLKFIDVCGPVNEEAVAIFPHIVGKLKGVALRRMTPATVVDMCGVVFHHSPNLTSIQLDGIHVTTDVEDVFVDILGDENSISIDRMILSNCHFEEGTLSRIFAVVTTTAMDKLGFKGGNMNLAELATCLFVPCVAGSPITELMVSDINIPESLCTSLYACITIGVSLIHLNLSGARLGSKCLAAVIKAVPDSALEYLNLSWTTIGRAAHKLYDAVEEQGKMKRMYLNHCDLCPVSKPQLLGLITKYESRGDKLVVSTVAAYSSKPSFVN
ncbi:unknown [Feldmannia species virus]|uniref:Uncharacterized protein n=1 Tax=Feldmannia species virus TaxID=39420 RepID=B5LWJ1_9PHYC|nr:hypothetical protein FeldSpV_gp102 [Feldmannia species virus]ACH46854.1 unknown [Feldmannia species virus]